MSNTTKTKRPEYLTPMGEVAWANIIKPGKNFKGDGEQFSIRLRYTADQAKAMIAQLTKLGEEARAALAEKDKKPVYLKYSLTLPIKPETDKDGNETGDFIFSAKASTTIRDFKTKEVKGPRTIRVFDSEGNLYRGGEIGRGSICRVSYNLSPTVVPGSKVAGVTAYINAVQIQKYNPIGDARDAAGYGFDKVEGGFVAPDGSEDAPFTASSETVPPTEAVGSDDQQEF